MDNFHAQINQFMPANIMYNRIVKIRRIKELLK